MSDVLLMKPRTRVNCSAEETLSGWLFSKRVDHVEL